MAQMFGQLQQLSQQLVHQQQMFQQSLEMQRQQSQVQMETLTSLGAAQVAKTTYDARDFQTKAFAKMQGIKGDEKAWPDWRYKFRAEASKSFRQAAAILDWAQDMYDQPISESDIQQVVAKENWADMANFIMKLHGDLVSLMEECTGGFETVRNTKTEVGLDVWRRLNHKYDPRNPPRNTQLLEKLLAPSQVGYADVVASMERLLQELRVVRQRFGDDVQNLWKSIHMVCIQKICPKFLRNHLAVQASSIDSPEKQGLTIEKFLQANVHGAGATPMDVDALAKTKGGKKGGKGKDKEPEAKKFDGNCFWCGAPGHVMKDCRKKAAGKPETVQSPRTPEPKAKGKGKGGQGKKGASSLDGWPDGQEEQPSGEKAGDEVASLFMGSVD